MELLEKMRLDFYAIYGKKKDTLSSLNDFENMRTLGGGSFGVVVSNGPTFQYDFSGTKFKTALISDIGEEYK